MSFDDLEKEIRKVKSEISEVEKRIEKIMSQMESGGKMALLEANSGDEETLFRKRVSAFLSKARSECKEHEENFNKSRAKFHAVVKIFCVKPKASDSEVTPEYFFSLWSTFCFDFKNAWKRETQKLSKQRLILFFVAFLIL